MMHSPRSGYRCTPKTPSYRCVSTKSGHQARSLSSIGICLYEAVQVLDNLFTKVLVRQLSISEIAEPANCVLDAIEELCSLSLHSFKLTLTFINCSLKNWHYGLWCVVAWVVWEVAGAAKQLFTCQHHRVIDRAFTR